MTGLLQNDRLSWSMAVLVAGIVFSAFGVVVSSHYARMLFVELQALEQQRDELNMEWGQLQIEQSTWATHGRIESVARDELELVIPDTDRIRVLRGASRTAMHEERH